MEVSVIYDLLAPNKLDPYRKKLENTDCSSLRDIHEKRKILENTFTEEQLKTIDGYIRELSLFEEYIDFQVELRALNHGIKIGIQLQHSIKDLYKYFDEENDYE